MELFRRKSPLAGILFVIAVLVITFVIRQFQKPDVTVYEGTYPGIRGVIEPRYEFAGDRIILRFDEAVESGRLVVFVYDGQGNQYGMLKDIRDKSITITPGDYPEYQAFFKGAVVEGYKVFKRVNGRGEGEPFLELMRRAEAERLRYGVQQCMYPVCTRCLDVCPVIGKGVIRMQQAKGGQIVPKVLFGSCPRSGKCFTVCTLGAFYKADLRHVQRNPEDALLLETELHPKVLR